MLADLLPTELAIQAKYVRMFLIGLMLQLVLRFRPEGLLPEDPARHHEIAAAEKAGGGGSRALPPTSGPRTSSEKRSSGMRGKGVRGQGKLWRRMDNTKN